eukprot:10662500-Alexandrium_andersonii.AAC.1
MSASLVGSEMCIRDSSSSGAAVGPGACVEAPDLRCPRRRQSPPQEVKTCLLYTSDAADDM